MPNGPESNVALHGLGTPGEEIAVKAIPNSKFIGTAEAYFFCHIGPIFQISLIYAFIRVFVVRDYDHHQYGHEAAQRPKSVSAARLAGLLGRVSKYF